MSVSRRPDGSYRVRWRDDQRQEHARHFKRRADAQAFDAQTRLQLQRGDLPIAARRNSTVGEAYEGWLVAHPEWAATTRERNRSVWRAHLAERWGVVRLRDLTRVSVQEWALKIPGARATKLKVVGALSSILAHAVDERWIARNPMEGVRLERAVPTPRRPYLTRQQVEDLAAATGDPQAELIVRFLAHTGVRVGEMAALLGGDVDASTGRIRIARSETEVNGKLTLGLPKNGKAREFYLPSWLLSDLADRLSDPDGRVFSSAQGAALRVRNMRRGWFDCAAKEIGVPDLTPHALRHTAASLAISAGLSVLQVQRMLGHARPSITLDTYSDLFQGDAMSGAEQLNSAHIGWVETKRRIVERAEEQDEQERSAAQWAASNPDSLGGF